MVMVVFTEDQLRAKIAEVVGRLDGRVDGWRGRLAACHLWCSDAVLMYDPDVAAWLDSLDTFQYLLDGRGYRAYVTEG